MLGTDYCLNRNNVLWCAEVETEIEFYYQNPINTFISMENVSFAFHNLINVLIDESKNKYAIDVFE